ncbi:MAG: IPT/TIG domain-containing protein [Candidatus Margulisbacteria bacterium]|nr:IPT/TIG domain-containing protein [Candidatus Margulisiibacteriota bacterium]
MRHKLFLGLILVLLAGTSALAVANPVRSAVNADGSRLYVPSSSGYIHIRNIADPYAPSSVSSQYLSATPYDVLTYARGTQECLFVSATTASGNGYVFVFDINSDPAMYSAAVSLPSGVSPRGVAVNATSILAMGGGSITTGHLYVAASNGKVYRYNVTDAGFLTSSNYTLSATYETGSAGLYGIVEKTSGIGSSSKTVLYAANRSLGNIIKIYTNTGTMETICSDATGVTYLALSADESLLFARVLQSDNADIRVFQTSDSSELTSMKVSLGGSGAVYSGNSYEGIYYAGGGLYFTKYDTAESTEKLYKYEPAADPAVDGWSRQRAIVAWTPGECDAVSAATYEAGWALWRTHSSGGSYNLIIVDTGTEEIGGTVSPEVVIDDYEGIIIPAANYVEHPAAGATLTIARDTGTVFEGAYSMKIQYSRPLPGLGTPSSYWTGSYPTGTTVDLTHYSTFRFHHKAASGSAAINPVTFKIGLVDSDGEIYYTGTYSYSVKNWTTVEVSLDSLSEEASAVGSSDDSFSGVISGYRVVYSGQPSSTVTHYLDLLQGASGEGNEAAAPTITVTSPNGGEIFTKECYVPISWETTGVPTGPSEYNIRLEYSTNEGTSYRLMTDITGNDGSYSWNLDDDANHPNSTQYRVRATYVQDWVFVPDVGYGGTSVCSDESATFTVMDSAEATLPPQITSITPSAEVWDTITINGSSFTDGSGDTNLYPTGCSLEIKYENMPAYISLPDSGDSDSMYYWQDGQIEFMNRPSIEGTYYAVAGTTNIRVTTPGGTTEESFELNPTIYGPYSGNAGETIEVTGNAFGTDVSVISVTIGGTPAVISSPNNTTLSVIVPASLAAGATTLIITVNGNVSSESFTVIEGAPTATNVPISLTYDPTRGNVFWISLPYINSYYTASGLASAINTALGEGADSGNKVTIIGRWDGETQSYEDYVYYAGLGWGGSDFALVTGEAVYVNIAADINMTLTGYHDPSYAFNINYDPSRGNIHWISLPYEGNYTDATSIIADVNAAMGYSPTSGDIVSIIGRWNGSTQSYEDYVYYAGLGWGGTSFTFISGEGYYINTAATISNWQPAVR